MDEQIFALLSVGPSVDSGVIGDQNNIYIAAPYPLTVLLGVNFNGIIDDFVLTNHSISQEEVNQLYDAVEDISPELVDSLVGPYTLEFVQEGISSDTLYVDDFRLYDDTVVWEVSLDDGVTWHRIYDIINMSESSRVLPQNTNRIKFRIKALNQDDWIAGYIVKNNFQR